MTPTLSLLPVKAEKATALLAKARITATTRIVLFIMVGSRSLSKQERVGVVVVAAAVASAVAAVVVVVVVVVVFALVVRSVVLLCGVLTC